MLSRCIQIETFAILLTLLLAYSLPTLASTNDILSAVPTTSSCSAIVSSSDCTLGPQFVNVSVTPYKDQYHLLLRWSFSCVQSDVRKYKIQVTKEPDSNSFAIFKNEVSNYTKTQYQVANLYGNGVYRIELSSPQVQQQACILFGSPVGTPLKVKQIKVHFPNPVRPEKVALPEVMLQYNPKYVNDFNLSLFREDKGIPVKPVYGPNKTEPVQLCSGQVCTHNLTLQYQMEHYMRYMLFARACNVIGECGKPVSYNVTSPPSNPGKMKAPSLGAMTNTSYVIHFLPPSIPNGPIDLYSVRQELVTNQGSDNFNQTVVTTIELPGNVSQAEIGVHCESFDQSKPIQFQVSIAALNRHNEAEFLQGEYSDPITVDQICLPKRNSTQDKIFLLISIIISILVIISVTIYICICTVKYINTQKEIKKKFTIIPECNKAKSENAYFEEQSLISNTISTSDSKNSSINQVSSSSEIEIVDSQQTIDQQQQIAQHKEIELNNEPDDDESNAENELDTIDDASSPPAKEVKPISPHPNYIFLSK